MEMCLLYNEWENLDVELCIFYFKESYTSINIDIYKHIEE